MVSRPSKPAIARPFDVARSLEGSVCRPWSCSRGRRCRGRFVRDEVERTVRARTRETLDLMELGAGVDGEGRGSVEVGGIGILKATASV